MDRRDLIRTAFALGVVASGCSAFPDPALDPSSDHFLRLENEALRRRGVSASSRKVELAAPRLNVRVLEVGSGDPLVMIHGGNGYAAQFIPLLERLTDRRLIVPDRPGFGLSDPFLYDDVDMRSHGVAVIESLLDACGLERADLLGNSLGGYWSLCFALDRPDRVSHVILAGGPAQAAALSPLSPEAIEARVRGSRQPGRAALAALMADPARLPDDVLALQDASLDLIGTEDTWRSIWRNHAAWSTYALRPELPGVSASTLLLWGEQDRIDPPVSAAAMAELLPDAQLQILPDAGHLPWLDHPDACAAAVHEFLA